MKRPPSLSSRREFQRVISTGVRRQTSLGTFYVASRSASHEPARLGLAVPAKTGGAVVRNRIKRRLREAFRLVGPAYGVDVVIRARPAAATESFQELESILSRTVEQ